MFEHTEHNWHRRSVAEYAMKAEAVGAVASNGFMLYQSSYSMIVTVSQSVSTAQRLSAGCPEESL